MTNNKNTALSFPVALQLLVQRNWRFEYTFGIKCLKQTDVLSTYFTPLNRQNFFVCFMFFFSVADGFAHPDGNGDPTIFSST